MCGESYDDLYYLESERLKTFVNWPKSFININKMAADGLYYSGTGDWVRCAFCGIEIGRWREDDDPLESHRRFSPDCRLITNREPNNVPLRSVIN